MLISYTNIYLQGIMIFETTDVSKTFSSSCSQSNEGSHDRHEVTWEVTWEEVEKDGGDLGALVSVELGLVLVNLNCFPDLPGDGFVLLG